MTTTPFVHAACHQPVDLTDDNRVLQPGTDVPHQCPVTPGPYSVIRWGSHWSIEDVLDTTKKHPRWTTQHEATVEADRRNIAYAKAHTPRPQPAQPGLFDAQEAS